MERGRARARRARARRGARRSAAPQRTASARARACARCSSRRSPPPPSCARRGTCRRSARRRAPEWSSTGCSARASPPARGRRACRSFLRRERDDAAALVQVGVADVAERRRDQQDRHEERVALRVRRADDRDGRDRAAPEVLAEGHARVARRHLRRRIGVNSRGAVRGGGRWRRRTARAPSRASVRTPRALVHAFCQCSAVETRTRSRSIGPQIDAEARQAHPRTACRRRSRASTRGCPSGRRGCRVCTLFYRGCARPGVD